MKISVVIPCRNEAPYIRECLDAIFACDIPEGIEMNVFVVDGMSDDGTRNVVTSYPKFGAELKLVDNTKQLTPYAFNLGIHAQRCDFVQIIGARHIVSSNYIRNTFEKLISDQTVWCVGGRLINQYTSEKSEIIAKAMSTPFGMGIGNFRVLKQSGFTDTVTSPMYPFWVFERIGYFDDDLVRNQDDDFNFRVTQAGGKIFFDAEISLKYYVRGNYLGLWRQFFQYGYWKVFVNRKHQAVTTVRQLVPPLFVLFVLSSLFVAAFPMWLQIGFGSIWISYVSLAFYFSIKEASSFKQLLLIAFTFPILHLSYGFGYLNGILDFVVFAKKPSQKHARLSR
jgi:glycosyltransferase involved in cell wall biosynthesis